MPTLAKFDVIVWIRETDAFPALRDELLALAGEEPDESTGYEGMVDFHWGFADLAERQHENAVIRVKDQGAGLSPEDLSRVFGRFQRLSAKPTGNEISTGLGLSIVKRIVDLHNGSVVAESPGPGLGATFTVTLPIQASAPTQQ